MTLDADLAQKLRDLAHRKHLPFKKVINDVIRRGLAAQELVESAGQPFVVTPHAGGFRAGVDLGKLNSLADQLETSDFLREAREQA